MKLRVALIGLGDAWEKRHQPAIRALSDRFEVCAVFDEVYHRAQVVADRFGARAGDGVRTIIAREDIDAVLCFADSWYGTLPALIACDMGKAIYLGAGLPLEIEESLEMCGRAEKAGAAFMAEFSRRHAPATLRLKELIATVLGPPRLIFCHQRLPDIEPAKTSTGVPYRCKRELVELADWCCYIADGQPQWVSGVSHQAFRADRDDYEALTLGFSPEEAPGRGVLAQISCGSYFPGNWPEALTYRPLAGMQVSCEQGVAFLDLPSTLVWFDRAGRHQESLEGERPIDEQILTQFHRAVTSLVTRTSDPRDAHRALTIVEHGRTSHREGRRIDL